MASAALKQSLALASSGAAVRIVGIPLTALFGLTNTALIVSHTGELMYGIVNAVATLGSLRAFS